MMHYNHLASKDFRPFWDLMEGSFPKTLLSYTLKVVRAVIWAPIRMDGGGRAHLLSTYTDQYFWMVTTPSLPTALQRKGPSVPWGARCMSSFSSDFTHLPLFWILRRFQFAIYCMPDDLATAGGGGGGGEKGTWVKLSWRLNNGPCIETYKVTFQG